MRSGVVICMGVVLVACGASSTPAPDGSDCTPACGDGEACRYATCVAQPAVCASHDACKGDEYCDASAMECLPWGIGPGGESDAMCHSAPVPGAFFPALQCAWVGPPPGDSFPNHVSVLATPMVASFQAGAPPSIVFPAFNGERQAGVACVGEPPPSDPPPAAQFAVLRVIDGATCEQQTTLGMVKVVATSPVAVADVDGKPGPEIIAARDKGGLVAFTRTAAGWSVLWESTSTLNDNSCNWSGPSIYDLDNDGVPEILLNGAVFAGHTGALIDSSLHQIVDSVGVGYIPVVADLDGDQKPELVIGDALYDWDIAAHRWVRERELATGKGQVAVADFGTFPRVEQANRAALDGVAEIAVIFDSVVQVRSLDNAGVLARPLVEPRPSVSKGGPLALADFDGDGRIEIAAPAGTALNLFDPDCRMSAGQPPSEQICHSRSIDDLLWAVETHGNGTDTAGASAFDFDGDGRAEAVYSDRCFSRIYDGLTGDVLYSRARTGCPAYEYPVVADTDGDRNAELVISSSKACLGVAPASDCPALDPLFDGARCDDDTDCAFPTTCARDGAAVLGRCRCATSTDCGDGLVCADPIAGPSTAGKVCRAGHPRAPITGIAIVADRADRWRDASSIWNQHAFSVTNIDAAGAVPRTNQWARNWTQRGLNSFRGGSPDGAPIAGATPDLSVKQAKVTCDASTPTVVAEVCNRGSIPVAAGVPVAVYTASTPSRLRCETVTAEPLAPGTCTNVSCIWSGAPAAGAVVIDDRGDGTGVARECREDNNALDVRVACP